jgi:hypothetical protein
VILRNNDPNRIFPDPVPGATLSNPLEGRSQFCLFPIPLSLLLILFLWALESGLAGCGWVGSGVRADIPSAERLTLAVLGFGMDIEITNLSSVQTVTEELPPGQEALLVTKAVREIKENAQRLLHSRLQVSDQYNLVSLEQTDAAVQDLGIEPRGTMTREQLAVLRNRLGADLVVAGTVLDYGKVRWQWSAAGMLGDLSWETVALGLATAWNPIAILANVGFELATSTPVWFGGGYLFGVAFRPVRVEAQAVETQKGITVWDGVEVAIYARGRLKELPEEQRTKKEMQLHVNLKKAMETLADSLLDERITKTTLWERRLPEQDMVSF